MGLYAEVMKGDCKRRIMADRDDALRQRDELKAALDRTLLAAAEVTQERDAASLELHRARTLFRELLGERSASQVEPGLRGRIWEWLGEVAP